MTKQIYVVMINYNYESDNIIKTFLSEGNANKYVEELNKNGKLDKAMTGYLEQRLTTLKNLLNYFATNRFITEEDVRVIVDAFNNKTIENLNKMEGKEENKQDFILSYLDKDIPRIDNVRYYIKKVELVE
jgi:hypothetical protein